MPLTAFTPLVRDWFANAFEEPTPAQKEAWPAIATGENVLISAPTGSGKTLAAFLMCLDKLLVTLLTLALPMVLARMSQSVMTFAGARKAGISRCTTLRR